ncbi:MAG: hypothetical protein AAB440_02525 [Patescibacteria group bacterium]
MSKEYEVPAFKAVLREHVDHEGQTDDRKLLQIGDDKNLVVRRMVYWEDDEKEMFGTLPPEERATFMTHVFSELRDKYNIPVVPFRFVVALDEEKQETLFAVVDNVTPVEMTPQQNESKTLELLERLVVYYEQKAESGAPFLWDISEDRQYVYGTTKDNQNPELYLVDLDPHIREGAKALIHELGQLRGEITTASWNFESEESRPYTKLIKRVDTLSEQLGQSKK